MGFNTEQQRAFKGVWIPAEIWLNEDLSLQEKALLADIDSFCSCYESCYASNEHFAKFIGVSTRRIKDIIKGLEDKKLIEREIVYKQGTKEIQKRLLRLPYPSGRNLHGGGAEKFPTPREEKFPTPGEENCPESNTCISNTNKSNTTEYKIKRARTREADCSPELAETLKAFEEHRKKLKKPMTDYAKKLLLGKLSKLAKTEQEQIAILNQSIENGWQGVFPLGGDRGQRNPRQSAADMASDVIRMMDERGMLDDAGGKKDDDSNAGSVPSWFSEQ